MMESSRTTLFDSDGEEDLFDSGGGSSGTAATAAAR
eukprot:COSAG04_NODE_31770_length_255_cov_0.615385_1_plen_35_part_01